MSDEFPLCSCNSVPWPHRHVFSSPTVSTVCREPTADDKWRELSRHDFDGAKRALLNDIFGR